MPLPPPLDQVPEAVNWAVYLHGVRGLVLDLVDMVSASTEYLGVATESAISIMTILWGISLYIIGCSVILVALFVAVFGFGYSFDPMQYFWVVFILSIWATIKFWTEFHRDLEEAGSLRAYMMA